MNPAQPQIARRRRELGWSQKRLADYLDVDPMSVSRWERGTTKPGPAAAKRIRHWLESGIESPSHLGPGFAHDDTALRNYPAIAELVNIVGPGEVLRLLREQALLRRAPSALRFPVDPAIRLQEVERARREQTELIERATISRTDRNGKEKRSPPK